MNYAWDAFGDIERLWKDRRHQDAGEDLDSLTKNHGRRLQAELSYQEA